MADPLTLGLSLLITTGLRVAVNLISRAPKPADVDEVFDGSQGEGAPLSFAWGNEAVVPVKILWRSRRKDKDTKGGTVTPKTTSVKYFGYIAAGLCVAPEGGIDSVRRFFAADDLVYNADPDINIDSDELSVTTTTAFRPDPDGGPPVVDFVLMHVLSPNGGPNLRLLKSGKKVAFTGWGNSGNNGTFRVVRTPRGPNPGETICTVFNFNAVAESAGNPVNVFQDLDTFAKKRLKGWEELPGDASQTLTGTIVEERQGVGVVEYWRGVSVALLDRFRIDRYGGQIPPMRAVIRTAESTTLRSIVQEIAVNSSPYITADDVDVSGIDAGITVRGYTPEAGKTGAELLEPLAIVYNLLSQERDGKLYFFTRENATERQVDLADLGAHIFGENDTPRPFEVIEDPDVVLPAKIVLSYIDPSRNYNRGTVEERAQEAEGNDERTISLPMTLSAEVARETCAKVKATLIANRAKVRGILPPKYLDIQENDVLVWTDADGKVWRVILDRVDRREDWLVEFEGVEEAPESLSFTRAADDAEGVEEAEVYVPAEPVLEMMDIAAIDNADIRRTGIRWSVAAGDPDGTFEEAALYLSTDGENFEPIDWTTTEATQGYAITELGEASPYYWDDVNTVDVDLYSGILTSTTREDIEVHRRNLCLVGRELLCFQTATLNADGTYTLSGLLRGLRNSDRFITEHFSTERFVLLDPTQSGTTFTPLDTSLVGQTLYFKAVPDGEDPDDYNAVSVSFTSECVIPWAPWRLRGDRRASKVPLSGGNNLFLQWERRTRELGGILGGKGLIETVEKYRVQILDSAGAGGGSVVFTTPPIIESEQYFLSATKQTALGLTPGDPVDFIVQQWSEILQDWGFAAEGTAD